MMITFKSLPENFVKERDGRKPNTLRLGSREDPRFVKLSQLVEEGPSGIIEIVNTDTGELFKRDITDVSVWDEWFIISWKHPI